jgi:hypothetical protein
MLATRNTALGLIAWEQRRSVLLDWAENGNGRLSVNPDALFGLKDREKPEGQDTTYFFLEVVRSRESDYQQQQSYFMRKMNAFLAYHRQGKHQDRLRARCLIRLVGLLEMRLLLKKSKMSEGFSKS